MCIAFLAIDQFADYPLVIAANRDEAYARPTRPLGFWPEDPNILAGRDLLAGGTWLGLARSGRLALLTNYREPAAAPGLVSRGVLVTDFLAGGASIADFGARLLAERDRFAGYNLIFGHVGELYYHGNRGPARIQRLQPGIHGLSNHLLNTPWPKVERGKAAVADLVRRSDVLIPDLFGILGDTSTVVERELPDTGIDRETERILSAIFIRGNGYGTRGSTLVLADRRTAQVVERTHEGDPLPRAVHRHEIVFEAGDPLPPIGGMAATDGGY